MTSASAPTPGDDGRDRELTVVMPVYNERDSVGDCVRSWLAVLDRLDIGYEVFVLDDGSRDGTADVLAELAGHPRVRTLTKVNEGHGPTILRGYRDAVTSSEWVFQVDSDDEIPAEAFPAVWSARAGRDAVLGVRVGRRQSIDRRLISTVARVSTRVLFGAGVADVNVPYRLIRADVLAPIVERIPDDTFAPNITIAGILARSGSRIAEVNVPHRHRRAGQVSIVGLGALRVAARSFVQTVRMRRLLR